MIEHEPADEILQTAVRRRATAVGVAPAFDDLRRGEYRTEPERDRRWRRGGLLAVAAVALVIAVAVFRPGGFDQTTGDPADQPDPDVVAVAVRFLTGVFESGDPAVPIALMTDDAMIYSAGPLDTDEGRAAMVGLVEYLALLDTRLTTLDCASVGDDYPESGVSGPTVDPPGTSAVTVATCEVAYSNRHYRAIGLDSSPTATMLIRIQDGLMFDSPYGPPPRSSAVEDHFLAWAYDEVGFGVVGEACPTWSTFRNADCAQLVLDHLDAWAEAWRADQPG